MEHDSLETFLRQVAAIPEVIGVNVLKAMESLCSCNKFVMKGPLALTGAVLCNSLIRGTDKMREHALLALYRLFSSGASSGVTPALAHLRTTVGPLSVLLSGGSSQEQLYAIRVTRAMARCGEEWRDVVMNSSLLAGTTAAAARALRRRADSVCRARATRGVG